jgi:hypothetical protein
MISERVYQKRGAANPIGPSVDRKLHSVAVNTWNQIYARTADSYSIKCPTYKGCSIDSRWAVFQTFEKWFLKHYRPRYHLDKDILVLGNKVYGPDTCCYIPQELNKLFTDHGRARGPYPQGVRKDNNSLNVSISRYGQSEVLGYFNKNNVVEASECYQEAKSEYVIDAARKYRSVIHVKVYKALLRRAKNREF